MKLPVSTAWMMMGDLLAVMLLSVSVFAQVPVILDANPTAVPMGGTHTFTASNGPITWSVTGGGSIDPVTGVYTPPAGVLPHDYSRGWQLLSNNSGYTVRVDGLPLAGRNAYWKNYWVNYNTTSAAQHALTIPGFPFPFFDNVIDNNELSRTIMNKGYYVDVFHYNTYSPPDQPWIQRTDRIGQFGWNYQTGDGMDHHAFRLNKDTGVIYEAYAHYPDISNPAFIAGNPTLVSFTSSRGSVETPATPQTVSISGGTGCWTAINSTSMLAHVIDGQHYALPIDTSACGAPNAGILMCASITGTCNSAHTNINTQASDVFQPYSNYIGWGPDLGRSPMSASGVHTQELYATVANCRAASNCSTADIGHSVGFSGYQYMFGPAHIWPAMGAAGGPPYVSGCTNSNPSTCTTATGNLSQTKPCLGQIMTPNCTFNVLFMSNSAETTGQYAPSFKTGNWTTLNTCTSATYDPSCFLGNGGNGSNTTNGAILATYVDAAHFTIPFDTTTWGASGTAFFQYDFMPVGANFRLNTSVVNTDVCSGPSYCDYVYVLLNTLKHYGMIYLDGAGGGAPGWVVRVNSSEFQTLDEQLAVVAMRTYFNIHPFDANIDVVNPASIIANKTARCSPQAPPICPNDATATTGEITVTGTNSFGSTSVDVIPEGTAVGVYPEYLSMVGGTTFQLQPWVSGNINTAVTYSCCTSVNGVLPVIAGVSVSSTGLVTAATTPQINTYLTANSNILPQAILTIASAADPNAKEYVLLDFWPVSTDGAIRMMSAGNFSAASTWSPLYNDGTNLWPGGQFAAQPTILNNSNWRSLGTDNGQKLDISNKIASWQGCVPAPCTDPGNLYWNALQTNQNDIIRHLVLPTGQYRVTMFNPPPQTVVAYGAFGQSVFDWELQGSRVASYVDAWAQTGATSNASTINPALEPHFYTGYKMTGIASVAALNGANGMLIQAIRQRVHGNPYGVLTSGLLIEPVSGPTAVQQSVLPVGFTSVGYSSKIQAYGGTAPYTYAQVGGSLPLGITLSSDGTVSGLPLYGGTYGIQVQATDSTSVTVTSTVGITVLGASSPPVSRSTLLPSGGTYSSAQSVPSNTAAPGAAICYSDDGATPNAERWERASMK